MSVAVEEKKDPAAQFRSQVDEQIAQTTGRIRAHDLLFGGLTFGALVAVYVTAMILTDKYLNLAEWVRQLALGGFLLVAAGIAYWMILRPLRKRINPLYAAAQVEKTIDDAKNSITGYVEAQEKGEVHVAVKAAMGAKAAQAVGEADVNRAVDHRSLIVAGSILLFCLLILAVLFFNFRPSQFSSLMHRAIYPFSSDPIAKRTQIELLKPEPAEPTITTGQTITIAVHIGGKVPLKNGPEHVRVLLRHNLADPNFEEIAMEEGETTRDWQVKVPDYLVQNGFWYRVTAGDNETPEYRVTVRTLPMFEQYEASYEYPAYTRKRPDKATGPGLRAYKGTKITLVVKTNREVKDGVMKFASGNLEPVAGKVVPSHPGSLEFKFTATEASQYKLNMTPLGGDKNTDSPTFALTIDSDLAPLVQITKPEDAETTAVANGQLQVDGTIGDDFGVDKARLRLRIDGRDLAPIPYMDGKSFLRASDNTWPTDLTFKMSADLAKLKFADGMKFEPKFGTDKPPVIEYWVEAIDNCTETKPLADWNNQVGNVGRSNVKRLRLTPPETEPERKQQIDNQKQQRGMEEKQHNQEQQKKLDNEDRKKPDQQGNNEQPKNDGMEPKKSDEPQNQEGQPKKNGEPKGTDNAGSGGMSEPGMPPKGKQPDAKTNDQKQPGSGTSPDMGRGMNTEPNTNPKPQEPKKGMNDAGMGTPMGMKDPTAQPPMAPPPQSPEDKKAAEDAKRVEEELNRNKATGGDAKPNPNADAVEHRADPAQPKPQPPHGDMGMEPQPKPDPKTDGAKPMPMGGDKNAPAKSKPVGKPEEKPNPDSAAKPGPQQQTGNQPMEESGTASEPRTEPLGGTPGEEKPQPMSKPKANPSDPKNANEDPMSGSSAKPASAAQPEPKEGDPSAKPDTKKDAANAAAQPKPNADPKPGMDKSTSEPKSGANPDEKPKPDPAAGDAKPKQAPPSAEAKPMPKAGDPMAGKQPEPSDNKPVPDMRDPSNPKGANVAEPKPDTSKAMGGGANEKPVDRGEDKPSDQPASASNSGAPKEKSGAQRAGKDGKKGTGDAAKHKELEKAAKDLTSPDPQKQQAARDKLDKELGKDARQTIEKEQNEKKAELDKLEKDLKSPDKATREAAEKKLKELQEQARKEAAKDGKGELTKEELKDLAEKARDLNSPDDAKRQAAEKAFDDKVGKEARQKIQDDVKNREDEFNKQFGDKEKNDLQKKIDEAAKKEKNPEPGQPKEPTQEEIADLAKKAQDLNSKDDAKRKQAEKSVDEALGEDARRQLQEEMKKQAAGGQDGPIDLKRRLEDQLRRPAPPTEPPLPAMEDNPRNRARSAELQLEEFEKHRYDRDLLDRLKWTDKEYEDFLKAQREQVDKMQKEADAFEQAQRDKPKPPPAGAPTIGFGPAGKVESREPGAKIQGNDTRVVVPPPGFEGSREKFLSKPKQK